MARTVASRFSPSPEGRAAMAFSARMRQEWARRSRFSLRVNRPNWARASPRNRFWTRPGSASASSLWAVDEKSRPRTMLLPSPASTAARRAAPASWLSSRKRATALRTGSPRGPVHAHSTSSGRLSASSACIFGPPLRRASARVASSVNERSARRREGLGGGLSASLMLLAPSRELGGVSSLSGARPGISGGAGQKVLG